MIGHVPRRVLSIGCGACATEALLQEKGADVWGIDIVQRALDIARARISRPIRADVETDTLDEVPIRSFDLVLCGDVLEHLRFPELVLDRVSKWITDDGQLIVTVPNFTNYRILKLLLVYRDWHYRAGGLFDGGHYRIFTRKSVIRMLESSGFVVDRLSTVRKLGGKIRFASVPLRFLVRLAPWLNDYLVDQWVVSARRCPRDGSGA